jgi:hypothetical protein
MTVPVSYNMCIYKGATFKESFTFTNDDGSIMSMEGWHIESILREENDSSSAVLARFFVDTAFLYRGEIVLSLTETETAGLPIRLVGYFDILCTDTNGVTGFYVKGTAGIRTTNTRKGAYGSPYFCDRTIAVQMSLYFCDRTIAVQM